MEHYRPAWTGVEYFQPKWRTVIIMLQMAVSTLLARIYIYTSYRGLDCMESMHLSKVSNAHTQLEVDVCRCLWSPHVGRY